jgi:LytS/YehU family sensor histidine kinase
MKVNDKLFFYEEQVKAKGSIHLRPDENFFSFEFAALNYTQPERQQYAYMLEGFDKDWIVAGNRRYVSYTNVPGGDYVFKVKTIDTGRENMIRIPLSIATPFYRTLWFYTLTFLLLVFILYLVYNARMQRHEQIHQLQTKAQLLEKEKALVMYESLKQQLNPHFLFNSLTSLNSLIVNDQKAAKNFLEQLSAIYRYILKSREHELVPLSNEIDFVNTYIQLQKTRFKEALQVSIDIDEEAKTCKIVPVTLENLVENAIKHNILDKDTPLNICVYTESDYVVVKNNLQKKKIVQTSNKQGLHNMKTLYGYLIDKPMIIEENEQYFLVKIPLI